MPLQDAPTRPQGMVTSVNGVASGYGMYGSYDPLEYVGDLLWPTSIRTYARMRHDPVLSSVLNAYSLPILKTKWHLDPQGAPARMVKICADSLGLPILGRDPKPGSARNRRVQWLDHVRSALSVLTFGHAVYEPVYDTSSGTAMLASLGERPQLSIALMDVNDQGELTGVTQYGDVTKPDPAPIPADRLLWYVRAKEGANWAGVSGIRHAYGAWLLKQDALRVQSTSHRRWGAGIPTVEWDANMAPTREQQAEGLRLAQSARAGDTAGVQMPPGARLIVRGVEGSYPDGMPMIRYFDEQMARGALTSMLDLGSTATGSRALGQSFAALLSLAQQATAELIAETATQLCERLVTFNAGEDTPVPAVVPRDLTVDEETLALAVASLIAQGAITPDDDTEAWLRDVYGAPAKRIEPNPAPPAPPVPPPASGPAPSIGPGPQPTTTQVTAARGTQAASGQENGAETVGNRPLSPIEKRAGFDPAATDREHRRILEALIAAYLLAQKAQAAALVAAVPKLAAKGPGALAGLTVDTTDAAVILMTSIVDAAHTGADLAITEAATQGVTVRHATPAEVKDGTIPAGAAAIDTDTLEDTGGAIADVLGQSLSATAARKAVTLATGGAAPDEVAAGVDEFLADLSDSWVEDQMNGVVQSGMGAGRVAVFSAAPPATFYASELLDGVTCVPCTGVNGEEYEDLDAALADYPAGQYVNCRGGYRCRGQIIAVYDEAVA